MAWVRRSRPCLAGPPADSPSTRYSSQRCGSRSEQSASLPGSPPPSSAPLRRGRARGFRGAFRAPPPSAPLLLTFARTRRFDRFVDDLARDRGVLLKECAQAFVDECLHDPCDVGVELALGLAF